MATTQIDIRFMSQTTMYSYDNIGTARYCQRSGLIKTITRYMEIVAQILETFKGIKGMLITGNRIGYL